MPTSNQQQTDTNNNSNNKIVNGRGVEVADLVPGQTVILSQPPLQNPIAAAVAAVNAPAATTTNSATVNLVAQQSPLIHNNHSTQQPRSHNINNNNNNNNSHHYNNHQQMTRPLQQQQSPIPSLMKHVPSEIKSNSDSIVSPAPTIPIQLQQYNSIRNNISSASVTRNNSLTQQQQQVPERSIDELLALIRDLEFDRTLLTNEELIRLVKNNHISIYKLESFLGKDNAARCVEVRRDFYRLELAELDRVDQLGIHDRADSLNKSQYEDLDYERVNGACCENVIGHVKVPVGLAGPLVLDGEVIFVPLATTEGCLVASTCRGLSALRKGGGVSSRVRRDFMTRAPIIRFQDPKLHDALDNVERAIKWLNDKNNKETMRSAFNLTSSHGKFLNYTMHPVNREIHIRFEAQTGDAMGMNMCSKGVESALKEMQRAFPTMEIVTLSGNMCTDKKAAGINWINGRGKSVECNAELPAHVVQQVFKVSVDQLVDRWKSKVMIGSALAASIGGFNSQAANILTAIFIATGQDPAQNVTSSNCMLILEKDPKGNLVVCCTMPSIECGTVGGGTILGDQSRYLQMMGVKGATPRMHHIYRQRQQQQQQTQTIIEENTINKCNNRYNNNSASSNLTTHTTKSHSYQKSNASSKEIAQQQISDEVPFVMASGSSAPINYANEYTNARKLARIICATVMAAELSLLAALTEGTLVKSHMRHNRSSTNVTSLTGSNLGGLGYSPPCSFEQSSYNNHTSNTNSHINNVNNNSDYQLNSVTNNNDNQQVLRHTNNDQRYSNTEAETDGLC